MILKAASGHSHDIAELERIAREHPSCARKAQQEIANIRKGDQGEESAAHFLDREYRDNKRIAVLHDIRLECADGDFAQIDHLLIHRIRGTAWILETKNYSGNLRCDEHGDWTVYYGSKPTSVPSPIEQARRQAIAFKRWFKNHDISGIHEVIPVVMVNPRSYISRKNLREGEHVVKSDNFARWFDTQSEAIGVAKAFYLIGRFAATGMDETELRALGARICRENQPANFDWEARMGVRETQIRAPAISRPNAEPVQRAVPTIIPNTAQGTIPERIATPHGDITIKNIGIDYAVRNPPHPEVIEIVKKACRGKGRWNPRYKNWLIPKDLIATVADEIGGYFT